MARTQHAIAALAAAALALMLVMVLPSAAAGAEVAFTISDRRIDESSGLARDVADNLYWTVNDSGSAGVVYGLTSKGAVRGTLRYRVRPIDTEAVAMVGSRLYVGDIGDNTGARTIVSVYYFDYPKANGTTVTYNSYDFSYPDGPHDAETLLVNNDGRIFVVTKAANGAVYAAPGKLTHSGVNRLTKIATAPGLVTDGTFLAGGQQIALRTYTTVYVLDASTYKVVASAESPKQPQGESLTLSLDGNSLLLGSEGKKSVVYAMPVPTGASASPSPGSTTDSGDGTDPGDDTGSDSGSRRTGTLLALGLAGCVAVVAGVVVGVARRR